MATVHIQKFTEGKKKGECHIGTGECPGTQATVECAFHGTQQDCDRWVTEKCTKEETHYDNNGKPYQCKCC